MRARSVFLGALGMGAVATMAVASCSLVTSYDCFTEPCSRGDAAGTIDAGAGCTLRVPPPRPDGGVLETDKRIILAMNAARLDVAPADAGPSNVGFDLDGLCTCQPAQRPDPGSCVNARATEPACDGPGGIDRQSTRLSGTFSRIFGDRNLQEGLDQGSFSLLIQLTGYDETANDGLVGVSLFNGVGLHAPDGGVSDGGAPSFDGGDDWILDSTSVVGGAEREFVASARDDAAYVAGGRLYARVRSFTMRFRVRFVVGAQTLSSTLDFQLDDIILSGDLVPLGGGAFKLERAELAARFPMRSALALASRAGACRGTKTYEDSREGLCALADLAGERRADAGAPCDAISFVLGLSAVPARYRGTADAPASFTPCVDDGGADDCVR